MSLLRLGTRLGSLIITPQDMQKVLSRTNTFYTVFQLEAHVYLIFFRLFFLVDCDLEAVNNCMGPFFYEFGLALHNKNESVVCG